MKSKIIRELFLSYFESNGHRIVPSSSLVPAKDPTLIFTNAGMNQFKDLFLGLEERDYKRAASIQKCVRAGGKHNDLENVGFTPRHHTFFEMLGNFSFGDYFKEDAIKYAWELSTKIFKIDEEKIWISVFKEDEEAFKIWNKIIGIPEKKILKLSEKDNFWAMGEVGPCGPCSELYYDLGKDSGCGKNDCTPEHDCGRFLEYWNLVFMQFTRNEKGELKNLPKPSIDTGAGLERVASILQNVNSNYSTDLFLPIIEKIEEIANYKYGKDKEKDIAMRVLSDHTRASSFLISDGIFPSNEGRGYVLRRIIRRALRFSKVLKLSPPIIGKIAPVLLKIFEDVYPEISKSLEGIKEITKSEEEKFEKTLEIGMEKLNEIFEGTKEKTIPGKIVFKLYDTYGIPFDFIEEVSNEKGFKIDKIGFDFELEGQRRRSRVFQRFHISDEGIYENISRDIKTKFLGYEKLNCQAKVEKILKDGQIIEKLKEGEEGEIIFDKTTFYGESGGQVGDKGFGKNEKTIIKIFDTQKKFNLIIHKVKLKKGEAKIGDKFELFVDETLRKSTQRHHTGTHILHYALRKVLGESVRQMGSLVEPKRLRFDFSYTKQLTEEEIKKIEEEMLSVILLSKPVLSEILPIEEAKKRGALAFFEEKYGEIVRIVSIEGISSEFCGGTHCKNTGEIGILKIVKEGSISSGIRRIEALGGLEALKFIQEKTKKLKEIEEILETEEKEVINKINNLKENVKNLQKKLKDVIKEGTGDLKKEEINGINLIIHKISDFEIEEMRNLVDEHRQKIKKGVVLVFKEEKDKGIFIFGVTKNLQEKIKASEIAKEFGKIIGGSGGGNPSLAQAGGKDLNKIKDGINYIRNYIKKEIKNE